jgi:hypothetical protein
MKDDGTPDQGPMRWRSIPLTKLRKDLLAARLEADDRQREATQRRVFYSKSRVEPSLPRLKFLERD